MPLQSISKPIGFINTQTLVQVSEQEIRALNPNTSFPVPFMAPEGYVLVFPSPQPAHTIVQSVREVTPVLTIKGHYEQAWEVIPRYVEYSDEKGVVHTVDEQIAAARATILQAKREGMICTPWQIRKAMSSKNIRADVEAAVASADQGTKDAYEFAQDFQRLNPLGLLIQAALGKSDAFMDELFSLAMTL